MNVYSFLPIYDVYKEPEKFSFLVQDFIKTLNEKWWTLSDSNRPPPECKSGALPDELRALFHEWWARVDLNYRPHPYQGCALTS